MSAAPAKFAPQTKHVLCFMAGLVLALSAPCHAQNPGTNSGGMPHGVSIPSPSGSSDTFTPPIGGSIDPLFQERRMRQLAKETHKSMVSDTDKLLALVTELSSEISTTNPGAFTPDQLKKIAQIEKLAHNVKEKMGNTLQGVPDNMPGYHR
jgi:hypothetical protein